MSCKTNLQHQHKSKVVVHQERANNQNHNLQTKAISHLLILALSNLSIVGGSLGKATKPFVVLSVYKVTISIPLCG